jgi:hypothetical protein
MFDEFATWRQIEYKRRIPPRGRLLDPQDRVLGVFVSIQAKRKIDGGLIYLRLSMALLVHNWSRSFRCF